MKERWVEQGKPLTYHLGAGGSLYKAFCLELDVACYGEHQRRLLKAYLN